MAEYIVKTEEAERLIGQVLGAVDEKDYEVAQVYVKQAYEIFKEENSYEGISICLSFGLF